MTLSRYLLLIGLLAISFSCRKNKEMKVDAQVIDVGEQVNLYHSFFLNGLNGFACGGTRDQSGYIFKTTDGGNNWSKFQIPDPVNIYSLHFINADTGYAGGDFLQLYKTTDGGQTWQLDWFPADEIPYHEVHRPAIRRFKMVDDSTWYFVGGENFETGTLYKTTNAGDTWTFDTLRHELRGLDFWDAQTGVIAGYGYVGCADGSELNQHQQIADFFSAVQYLSQTEIVMTGYNGGIYKSYDGGQSWEKMERPNGLLGRRNHFNDVHIHADQTGYAVGDDGLLMHTTDNGESWQYADANIEGNIHHIFGLGNAFYLAAADGKIYVIE